MRRQSPQQRVVWRGTPQQAGEIRELVADPEDKPAGDPTAARFTWRPELAKVTDQAKDPDAQARLWVEAETTWKIVRVGDAIVSRGDYGWDVEPAVPAP